MLERQDLEAIRDIVKEEVSASEERTLTKVEGMIDASEERTLTKVEGMIDASEERTLTRVEGMIGTSEGKTLTTVGEMITDSENKVLSQLDWVQEKVNGRIDSLSKELEELKGYYKIAKAQNDNTALILQRMDELTKRIERLEEKIA